ncbi:MAG: hypothetical protein WBG65_04880 [Sulfurimonadaceae bacterium]
MPQLSEGATSLVEQIFKLYNKILFTKEDLSKLMNVSLSYIDKSLARGFGVPNYKKLGNASNSKVVFNINDVAEYLSDTTKMA